MTKINRRKREVNDMASSPRGEAQPMSLRERKKRLAQATIEEAALRLFQQRGYEQTSIQDIADAVMMSSRTFFRYFASKEEVLFEPMRAVQSEGLRSLQQVVPTASPHAVLRATFVRLAHLYQQQRANFLLRYQVAMKTPSVASAYLYALMETEPTMCDALCSQLEAATNRNEIRFLVAIYMAALRVALEEWLEQDAQGDLVSLLGEHLDAISSLSQLHDS
jgi:AcrR family transcriptional regulator